VRIKLLHSTDLGLLKDAMEKRAVHFDPGALLDHVVYMFEIEDCTRVTSHQLVRHRMASYDQESQRFSSATREGFVTPSTIKDNEAALRAYDDALKVVYDAFEKMTSLGVPKEDARYVLPSAIRTKLVMTVSARSLMHVVWQRTALQAQWEIRAVVGEMFRLAKEVTPELWTTILER
jgi:thymidylate synthase (FAD)